MSRFVNRCIAIIIGCFFLIQSAIAQVSYDPSILYPSDDTLIDSIIIKHVDWMYSTDSAQRSASARQSRINHLANLNDEVMDILAGSAIESSFNEDYIGLPPPEPDNESAEALLPRMGNYYTVTLNAPVSFSEIKTQLDSVNALDNIEIAYPVVAYPEPATPDFYQEGRQSWLQSTPNGINADKVWNIEGGKGEGIRLIDFEYAYNKKHEDLPNLFYDSGKHRPNWSNDHGTAVIGQIAAQHNRLGVRGIAPKVEIGFQSAFWPIGKYEPHLGIKNAATQLRRGDILLIEQQFWAGFEHRCSCSDTCDPYVPLELWPDAFDAIQYATRKGIIVIAAAGNGGVNLDDVRFNGWFNRNQNDSGAIIVAASDNLRKPMCFTSYGSRIDAHGLGVGVGTTGYGGNLWYKPGWGSGNSKYTYDFGGTSSASPMVAGSAVLIQSLLKAQGEALLTPKTMRALLHNTGVHQSGNQQYHIANFPDINQMAKTLNLEITEDDILDLIIPLLTKPQ